MLILSTSMSSNRLGMFVSQLIQFRCINLEITTLSRAARVITIWVTIPVIITNDVILLSSLLLLKRFCTTSLPFMFELITTMYLLMLIVMYMPLPVMLCSLLFQQCTSAMLQVFKSSFIGLLLLINNNHII